MRKLIALTLTTAAIVLAVRATVPVVPTTVRVVFTMNVDTNYLGGLTPSQFGSNFTALVWSTTDITVPTNQWPIVMTIPCGPLIAAQGPPGTWWTNPLVTDSSTRFYIFAYSNNANGGVGPFSNLAPYFYRPPPGTVGVLN